MNSHINDQRVLDRRKNKAKVTGELVVIARSSLPSQDLKKDSTTRKTESSQSIYDRGDEMAASEEPFGLAYDVDDLPKISMVHTLDRLQGNLKKRSTFIDIYSEDTFEPTALVPMDVSSQDKNFQYTKKKQSEASLNLTGSPKRGILYEAACNAKMFAREIQRVEKINRHYNSESIGDNLQGAMKRKQNQRQRRVIDMRVGLNKRSQTERLEVSRKTPLAKGAQSIYNYSLYEKRNRIGACDNSIGKNERSSVGSPELSLYIKSEPVGNDQKKFSLLPKSNKYLSL